MTARWRRMLTAIAAALGAALLGIVVTAVPAAGATASTPAIQTSATEIVSGERVDVMLSGWPAGVVSVSICGERAASGSPDCATAESALIVAAADGTGSGSLVGALPPKGCPCVLYAKTLTGELTATLPVVLPEASASAGVPERTPTVVPISRLVVAASATPLGDWFDHLLAALGGGADYRLAVTVQNTGGIASTARTADVVVGRDSLGGDAVAALTLAPIEPGELVTHEVDVRVGAPLVGTYVLHGEIDPADNGSVFVVEVTSWPILPAVAVLFFASWTVLAMRARRRRLDGKTDDGKVPWTIPVLRAVAVTAVVSIVVVSAHWGLSRWLEHSRAAQAQSELLAGFAPALGSTPADARQVVRQPAAVNLPATGDFVGVLRVPALSGLELAVVAGVTPEQLARGPGHYPGTALPGELGNVVVAGHNSRTNAGAPFVDLEHVRVGDAIVLETSAGAWTYTVTATRVVPPTAVSVLLPVRDDPVGTPVTSQLTLITCDYSLGATNRLVVEAEIVDPSRAPA